MSMTFFAEKNRSLLAALILVLTLGTFTTNDLNAEDAARINTKSLTQDLDKKNDALAEEEAKLLASIDGEKKEAVKAVTKQNVHVEEDPRASIDLRKIADTIAHSDAPIKSTKVMPKPAKMQIEEKPAPAVVKVKTSPVEAAPRAVPQPVENLKTAAPQPVKQEVVRQIIKESDPELRKEVTTMGNLFAQWQAEFEQKHAKVLDMQQKQQAMVESVDARLDSIERTDGSEEREKRVILTEENRLLKEEKLALENSTKDFDNRLSALEKSKNPEKGETFGEQMKTLLKDSNQVQEKLAKQEELLKSLKLADGQLRRRMTDTENQTGDAMREITSVKLSVDRIETNLTELSEQLVESLKYRPHAVYDANVDWSEYPYDWNTPGPRYSRLPHNAAMSDMPMVTVTETTANLWSGPEEDDKIITTIRRGGQLAVEATELDWYRVIMADGRRAWIPARSVIHNDPEGKDTTLRIASAE